MEVTKHWTRGPRSLAVATYMRQEVCKPKVGSGKRPGPLARATGGLLILGEFRREGPDRAMAQKEDEVKVQRAWGTGATRRSKQAGSRQSSCGQSHMLQE